MHRTNVPRYRNRFHPRYPAPSSRGIPCLPPERLEHFKGMSRKWSNRKACSRREPEPRAGSLNHAGKVVRPGRSFFD